MSELENTIHKIHVYRRIKKACKDMELELYFELEYLNHNFQAGIYGSSFNKYDQIRIKRKEEIKNKYQKLIKSYENK